MITASQKPSLIMVLQTVLQAAQNFIVSAIIYCGAVISYIFSINVVEYWDWIFRAFSMISLLLIIGANSKKGLKGYRDMFKQFIQFFRRKRKI